MDVAFMEISMPEFPEYDTDDCQVCGTDLLEGCAGTARPTHLAAKFELRASPSADKEDGWDLTIREGSQKWKERVTEDKPLVVVIGFPCTLWCSYNVNFNYVNHPELLEKLRTRDRKLISLIKWTIEYQVKNNMFS